MNLYLDELLTCSCESASVDYPLRAITYFFDKTALLFSPPSPDVTSGYGGQAAFTIKKNLKIALSL